MHEKSVTYLKTTKALDIFYEVAQKLKIIRNLRRFFWAAIHQNVTAFTPFIVPIKLRYQSLNPDKNNRKFKKLKFSHQKFS